MFTSLAKGGQTWAHRIRMLRQVIKIALMVGFLVGALVIGFKLSYLDDFYHLSTWYNLKAKTVGFLTDKVEVDTVFWKKIAREQHKGQSILVDAPKVIRLSQKYTDFYIDQCKIFVYDALLVALYVFFSVLVFFVLRGSSLNKKKHLKGAKKEALWKIALKMRLKGIASDITIGGLPLIKGSETQHIMVSGGTGSGKTQCFHNILPQIRKKKQKAVIIDSTGEFIKRYYREGKDIILNPYDSRSADWHPWIECEDSFDFDSLAESFIPTSAREGESYWRTSAQLLFSAILKETKDVSKISDLSKALLFDSLAEICKSVEGTKAASVIDINSERTASSVRSVAASFLTCLEDIKDTDDPFSIRSWVENDDDSWLFISSTTAQRSNMRPLLSAWTSIAMRSLLRMEADIHRRLWFVIDEIPSLHRLKDFESFLTEARKYGGCALFALQTPTQLEKHYGWETSKEIIGNALTKVVFSEQDPEIAKRLSEIFGENEIQEYQEGLSYGAHEMRDGVSLSLQTKKQKVISASDIQSLPKLKAFVRLPGIQSFCKVKIPISQI